MSMEMPESVRVAVEGLIKPYGLSVEGLQQQQQKKGVEKRYLNVKEAVLYTSLARCTLSRATKSGRLPQIKMSPGMTGKVLYDLRDLDRFMLGAKSKQRKAV